MSRAAWLCQYWLGSLCFPGAAPRLGHRSSRGSGGAEAAGRYCPAVGPARPPAGAAAMRARPAGGRRAAGFQVAPTVPFPSSGHGIPINR
jgi:hypothetical protein